MSQQPQPSMGVQYILEDLKDTKFKLMVAIEQLAARDARIAELEKNQRKAKSV